MSPIVINSACKISKLLPMAEREVLSTIKKQEIFSTLTRKQLAAVMIALDAHWKRAASWKEKEILDDGYIWDTKTEKLLDFYDREKFNLVNAEI